MKEIKEKHPFFIRWTHWINFPLLIVMIWSGLLIYWADSEYSIGFLKFFPKWFYKLLNVPHRLGEGMSFHFLFMWFFILNGFFYVFYTIVSGVWKQLLPNRNSFKEASQVLLHDLHIRKSLPPQEKYNGAQRIAYSSIILMGIGSVLTGLAIYKPVQFNWLTLICGGYHVARIIHFILTMGYVFFFVIHLTMVILAGWNNFRAMVAGFEVIHTAPATVMVTIPRTEEPPPQTEKISEAEDPPASGDLIPGT